jgi:hypothetical protein
VGSLLKWNPHNYIKRKKRRKKKEKNGEKEKGEKKRVVFVF